jgi:hypothetical protein
LGSQMRSVSMTSVDYLKTLGQPALNSYREKLEEMKEQLQQASPEAIPSECTVLPLAAPLACQYLPAYVLLVQPLHDHAD